MYLLLIVIVVIIVASILNFIVEMIEQISPITGCGCGLILFVAVAYIMGNLIFGGVF